MTDTPSATPSDDDVLRDDRLRQPVLDLVGDWLRRARETRSARVEAAIDRGSFESFPASDPVASATATREHLPAIEEIDCTMRAHELVFRLAADEPDPDRPPPAWIVDAGSVAGRHLRLRVWVEEGVTPGSVPAALELEPIHASLRARQHERRGGTDRRVAARALPAGFDRRHGERRGADGATA